jgi:hypothetical protein
MGIATAALGAAALWPKLEPPLIAVLKGLFP